MVSVALKVGGESGGEEEEEVPPPDESALWGSLGAELEGGRGVGGAGGAGGGGDGEGRNGGGGGGGRLRADCGYPGIEERECVLTRGCKWDASTSGVPWCYH